METVAKEYGHEILRQESECLWLLNSPKRGRKICLYKICQPRPKKGKIITIKKFNKHRQNHFEIGLGGLRSGVYL